MSNINDVIKVLIRDWATPKEVVHRGQKCPFKLVCTFAEERVHTAELPPNLPHDMYIFWRLARSAVLFKDSQFGQWGLEIFDPREALRETSSQSLAREPEFVSSDFVIGRFLGDSDLAIIDCDKNRPSFGCVMIALPIDRRANWPVVAESFGEFLQKMLEAQGDKYWE